MTLATAHLACAVRSYETYRSYTSTQRQSVDEARLEDAAPTREPRGQDKSHSACIR